MLKNYLIIFWKVLQRHRFFTFVSLFGVSITLMVLTVLSAIFDSTFGAHGPEKHNRRILYIFGGTFSLKKEHENSTMRGAASYYFYEQTLKRMKTPEQVTILSFPTSVVCYTADAKIDAMKKYTDAGFWDVFEFKFLYGKPYSGQNVDLAAQLAVLDLETSEKYFGFANSVGHTIKVDGKDYRVCGVVEGTSITRTFPFANIYLPVTTSGRDLGEKTCNGIFLAAIKAGSSSDRKTIQDEYQQWVRKFQFPDPEKFSTVTSYADSYLEIFSRNLLGRAGENPMVGLAILLVSLLVLIFMSFPAMNLVNINITRILERASEIGIRRSFGASVRTLLIQFLTENILLTLIGGCMGFLLALLVIYLINRSGIIPYFFLSVNFSLFFYAILLSLVFGFLSGVLPAWRMARMDIVTALKS